MSKSTGLSNLWSLKKLALIGLCVIIGLIGGCVDSTSQKTNDFNPANFTITNVHKTDSSIGLTITDKTPQSILSCWIVERPGKTIMLDGARQKITLPTNSEWKITLTTTNANGEFSQSRIIKIGEDGLT